MKIKSKLTDMLAKISIHHLINLIAVTGIPLIALLCTPLFLKTTDNWTFFLLLPILSATGIFMFWLCLSYLVEKTPAILKFVWLSIPLALIIATFVVFRLVNFEARAIEYVMIALVLAAIFGIVLASLFSGKSATANTDAISNKPAITVPWTEITTVLQFVSIFTYMYFVAVCRDKSGEPFLTWQELYLLFSIIILCVIAFEGIALSFKSHHTKRFFTFSKSFPTAVFLSAFFLMFAVYYFGNDDSEFQHLFANLLPSILNAIQHTMRLFALDGDLMVTINAMTAEWENPTINAYVTYSSILYFVAPICTFTFALNFVKNLIGTLRYFLSPWLETHIFSELNEKTYAIAKSILATDRTINTRKRRFRKPQIIFTDITAEKEEKYMDLIDRARRDGAILMRKDLTSIQLHLLGREHHIYIISDDNEQEKLAHASHIIQHNNHKNVTLYIFSDSDLTKGFLEAYSDKEKSQLRLTVKRINDIRMLIYHELAEKGYQIFEKARPTSSGIKTINAVIVGLGQYGMEMLKALLWFCQLPGYKINITVVDEKATTINRAKAALPNVFGEQSGTKRTANYTVTPKVCAVGTEKYYELFNPSVSFVFISLGSDETNLATARATRIKLHSEGGKTDEQAIVTVIYDSELAKKINYDPKKTDKDCSSTNKFTIQVIGDLESFYSINTLFNSSINTKGYRIHRRWDDSETSQTNFYMSDYNMHSSIAAAIHKELRSDIIEKATENYPKLFAVKQYIFKKKHTSFIFKHTISGLRSDIFRYVAESYVELYKNALLSIYFEKMNDEKKKPVLEQAQDMLEKEKKEGAKKENEPQPLKLAKNVLYEACLYEPLEALNALCNKLTDTESKYIEAWKSYFMGEKAEINDLMTLLVSVIPEEKRRKEAKRRYRQLLCASSQVTPLDNLKKLISELRYSIPATVAQKYNEMLSECGELTPSAVDSVIPDAELGKIVSERYEELLLTRNSTIDAMNILLTKKELELQEKEISMLRSWVGTYTGGFPSKADMIAKFEVVVKDKDNRKAVLDEFYTVNETSKNSEDLLNIITYSNSLSENERRSLTDWINSYLIGIPLQTDAIAKLTAVLKNARHMAEAIELYKFLLERNRGCAEALNALLNEFNFSFSYQEGSALNNLLSIVGLPLWEDVEALLQAVLNISHRHNLIAEYRKLLPEEGGSATLLSEYLVSTSANLWKVLLKNYKTLITKTGSEISDLIPKDSEKWEEAWKNAYAIIEIAKKEIIKSNQLPAALGKKALINFNARSAFARAINRMYAMNASKTSRLSSVSDPEILDCITEVMLKTYKNITNLDSNYRAILSTEMHNFIKSVHSIEVDGNYAATMLDEILNCAADIEHVRWNAYIVSEGFRFKPGKPNKEFKTHCNLVPVSQLSITDKIKDI